MRFLIPQHLDYHCRFNPQNIAVECLDEKLSYSELQKKSNQLANRLIELGVRPGARIGIYMDKCLETAVAVYGILKAGAAYVPLDPSAPASRLVEIIADCSIEILISHENKQKRLLKINQTSDRTLIFLGVTENSNLLGCYSWQWVYQNENHSIPQVDVIESSLAYIIYTSGSTGIPKGIMHTHHSCLSFARWAATEYGLEARDKIGNHSPLHFDISIFDWFASIVAGASIILIPDEYTKMPASYSQLIEQTQITVLFTVPFALIQLSLFGILEQRDMSSLRWIIFGGEPFVIKHLYRLTQQLPNVTFDNMYGPAEVNGCTHYTIVNLQETDHSIPIGRQTQIVQTLVVDADDKEVSVNDIGELLVRTPTMMQGYWARPDLNQQAFHQQIETEYYDGYYKKVFYRTGDLVKIDNSGLIWFMGRKDRQVKVRGYRVELDEIEAILGTHQYVEEAAVYAVKRDDQPVEIHGAYTLKSDVMLQTSELIKFLKGRLPNYSVPAKLTNVQAFPRTTSDKIDRTTLSKEALCAN
jgi:amino acid adenylation domain-containing protein